MGKHRHCGLDQRSTKHGTRLQRQRSHPLGSVAQQRLMRLPRTAGTECWFLMLADVSTCLHRGENRHPPGSACDPAAGLQSSGRVEPGMSSGVGMDSRSACVWGICGDEKTRKRPAPSRQLDRRTSQPTRLHIPAAIPRLWVIRRTAIPSSSRSLLMRSRICA